MQNIGQIVVVQKKLTNTQFSKYHQVVKGEHKNFKFTKKSR